MSFDEDNVVAMIFYFLFLYALYVDEENEVAMIQSLLLYVLYVDEDNVVTVIHLLVSTCCMLMKT